ncbi:MAG: VTT domain-containing protein [Candidatus Diapherotrites archaeon]
MRKKRLIDWIIFAIFLIILGFLLYSYITRGFFYSLINFNQEEMILFISSFKGISFLIYILLIIAGIVLAPIHPFFFYVAGGIVFGPYVSWILIMIGVAIGSSIAFKIARIYGRAFVEKKIEKKHIDKFDAFSDKYGKLSIFILRVNPLTSSDIWSYLAGLTKMKLREFLIWTLLGLAPAIFIQTYFGKEIGKNPLLFKIFLGIAIIYLTALLLGFLYFLFFKKTKKRQKIASN